MTAGTTTPPNASATDPVAIIGLGKIGLALAGHYLQAGCRVIGCDIAEERLRDVSTSDIARQEPGLEVALAAGVRERRFTTTTDAAAAARDAHATIVVVPVSAHDGAIDAAPLEDAAGKIAAAARPGSLVVIETTVPVGTTRRLLARAHADRQVLVAYSPERVSVGRIFRDLRTYPKVVGGIDDESLARAVAFYEGTLGGAPVAAVGSLETAEFVKLIETTYRYVNIALANEFALAADEHGIDVSRAIEAANTQPYSHIHAPGVGVGGHCIPVYPHFFEAGATDPQLVRTAREVNAKMTQVAVRKLTAALGSLAGVRVLLLGLAFRPGVKESANSPAFALARSVADAGGAAEVSDPLYGPDEVRRLGLSPAADAAQYDAVVLVTAHPGSMDTLARVRPRVVLDGRNALDRAAVEALGIRYLGMGRR